MHETEDIIATVRKKFERVSEVLDERGRRVWAGVKKDFTGKHFWSRGYCVSTVGLDEATVRAYVRNQEELDRQESLDFDN